MSLFRLAACLGLAAIAGCAPTQSAAPPLGSAPPLAARQCFFTSRITGFRDAGNQTVNLRVGTSEVYQVALVSPCPEVRTAERILVDSRGAGVSVCTGLDADVIVPARDGPPRRCLGRGVRKLTPAEAAGLPSAQRP